MTEQTLPSLQQIDADYLADGGLFNPNYIKDLCEKLQRVCLKLKESQTSDEYIKIIFVKLLALTFGEEVWIERDREDNQETNGGYLRKFLVSGVAYRSVFELLIAQLLPNSDFFEVLKNESRHSSLAIRFETKLPEKIKMKLRGNSLYQVVQTASHEVYYHLQTPIDNDLVLYSFS